MLIHLYLNLFLILVIFFGLFVGIYVVVSRKYMKTEYYQATHLSYLQMRLDKGRTGEYFTYKYLKPLSGIKRYLFNCYLPKDDGTVTEIDVILIHESGIYVFESKNYSGWIFGTETQTNWTQTLPVGKGKTKKFHFFNPIIQNNVHIKWLQNFLHDADFHDTDLRFYSYIVFSDRCTLKNIKLTSGTHFVINRYNILQAVSSQVSKSEPILSQEKIDFIYEKLYPLTQKDQKFKEEHVENIQMKHQHKNNEVAHHNEATRHDEAAHHNEVKPQNKSQEGQVKSSPAVCPFCGGSMILRTAKKGQHSGEKFWGCSNYPQCRYIIKYQSV